MDASKDSSIAACQMQNGSPFIDDCHLEIRAVDFANILWQER